MDSDQGIGIRVKAQSRIIYNSYLITHNYFSILMKDFSSLAFSFMPLSMYAFIRS